MIISYMEGFWYYREADCYVPNEQTGVKSLNHNTHFSDGTETEMYCTVPDLTVEQYHAAYCTYRDGKWYYTC